MLGSHPSSFSHLECTIAGNYRSDGGPGVVLVEKNQAAKAGDVGLIPELGRSPEAGHGNQLKYSFLENPMDRRA